MQKSIHKMFNTIVVEGPPNRWNKMTIKSTYKNKGSKSEVINRRGIFNLIMDNNRRLNKNTYLILADAEKCFDKLWLQDCLVDLCTAGMREKEYRHAA